MPLPSEISTTFLLPRPARCDMDRVLAALAPRMTENCLPFQRLDWHQTQLLSSPDMHLQLRSRDLPVPGERLESALSSELAGLMHDDPSVAVARHRAAAMLRVGTGPRPQMRGQTCEAPSREMFERMLILAHAAATQLAQDCPTLAVHWGQSDQLLTSSRFAAMGNMLFPLPLFLHPRPHSIEQRNETWLSLDVEGAQHLLGHRLRTEYAPVSLPWMMQRVYAFVAHLRATERVLADGMEFATADNERFRVGFDPDGRMYLRLVELYGKPVEPLADNIRHSAA